MDLYINVSGEVYLTFFGVVSVKV